MAPPCNAPRLGRIIPEQLGEQIICAMTDRISSYAISLSPVEIHVGRLEEMRASTLWHEILGLCAWAQRGEGDPNYTHDLCLAMATACWRFAIQGDDREPRDVYEEADQATETGLLIVAGFAGEKIHCGYSTSPRELAALAGLTQHQVRLLVRDGEMKRDGEAAEIEIPATEARRWLASREVPGFAAAKKRRDW